MPSCGSLMSQRFTTELLMSALSEGLACFPLLRALSKGRSSCTPQSHPAGRLPQSRSRLALPGSRWHGGPHLHQAGVPSGAGTGHGTAGAEQVLGTGGHGQMRRATESPALSALLLQWPCGSRTPVWASPAQLTTSTNVLLLLQTLAATLMLSLLTQSSFLQHPMPSKPQSI